VSFSLLVQGLADASPCRLRLPSFLYRTKRRQRRTPIIAGQNGGVTAKAFFRRAGQSPAKWFNVPSLAPTKKRAPDRVPFSLLVQGLADASPCRLRLPSFLYRTKRRQRRTPFFACKMIAFSRQGVLQTCRAKPC